jgi:hypothetical protein
MNLLYSFILTVGIINGGLVQYCPYEYQDTNPMFTEMEVDVQWGHFFFDCGIRTDIWPKSISSYDPYQNTYQIGAGLRFKYIEIGISHSCYHPMQTYQWAGYQMTPSWEGAINTFYGRLILGNRGGDN